MVNVSKSKVVLPLGDKLEGCKSQKVAVDGARARRNELA